MVSVTDSCPSHPLLRVWLRSSGAPFPPTACPLVTEAAFFKIPKRPLISRSAHTRQPGLLLGLTLLTIPFSVEPSLPSAYTSDDPLAAPPRPEDLSHSGSSPSSCSPELLSSCTHPPGAWGPTSPMPTVLQFHPLKRFAGFPSLLSEPQPGSAWSHFSSHDSPTSRLGALLWAASHPPAPTVTPGKPSPPRGEGVAFPWLHQPLVPR